MFDLEKLKKLSESYTTYLILGAVATAAGLFLGNLSTWVGGWVYGLANMLTAPGHALVVLGFIAAGVASDRAPNSVRIACVVVGIALFLSFTSVHMTPPAPKAADVLAQAARAIR